jgi:hypothetical protein
MRIFDLEEARRNPTTNTVNRTHSGINDLLAWVDQGGCYATFTSLPKVGVNPRSPYRTPIGVYCYPLDDSEVADQVKENMLPFAGDAPYINVLRPTGEVLDLLNAPDEQYVMLNQKVCEWLADRMPVYNALDERLPGERVRKLIWEKVYVNAVEAAAVKTIGGRFWAFTRWAALIAQYINHDPEGSSGKHGPADIGMLAYTVDNISKEIKGAPAAWTRLFLDIGVSGVVDYGSGIIHSNEPTQAVFFSPQAFKVAARITNPRKKVERTVITTSQELMRALTRVGYLEPMTRRAVYFNLLKVVAEYEEGDGDALYDFKGTNPHTQTHVSVKIAFRPKEWPESYFKVMSKIIKSSGENAMVYADAACHSLVVAVRGGDQQGIVLWCNFILDLISEEEMKALIKREYFTSELKWQMFLRKLGMTDEGTAAWEASLKD